MSSAPTDATTKPIPYPPDVKVVRQIAISRFAAPDDPLAWLMSGVAKAGGLAELLDGVMARIVAGGIPVERGTLHMGTLHPQLIGLAAMWRPGDGVCEEVRVDAHVRETDSYLKSPLRFALEKGEVVRIKPHDAGVVERFPMMKALAVESFTDYVAVPLEHAQNIYNVVTISTRAPEGFSDEAIDAVKALLPAFSLNLEIVALRHIAENVLSAYLGERSGRLVLAGEIKRGSGEMIDAIVWVSDMRGYTALSDRLPEADMLRLLNAYFGRLVEAVERNGGEVLKFMGDGMLAIFPIGARISAAEAASRALTAAKEGLAAVLALNGSDGDALKIDTPWRPVDMGIGLHRGAVFYGNIGADDRLDFTVTGPTVNLAARVEPLAKEAGRRLLVTEAVATLLHEPLEPLGAFSFRGVAEPVAVFTTPE
jgi:adenylate cyclase